MTMREVRRPPAPLTMRPDGVARPPHGPPSQDWRGDLG